MAVTFILGKSGTGKTTYCIKQIISDLLEAKGQYPLILLVPEQATYQAERAILSDKSICGYSRLHVLSFNRLQFLLLGRKTAQRDLSRIGQQMIIHKILRANGERLKVFKLSANQPGLSVHMADMITELHQYAKGSDDIDELIGQLQKDKQNMLSAEKFSDISLIFSEYIKFIDGKFIDPDVQLLSSCRAVSKSSLIEGAHLWVDGFSGFTASEQAILLELLKTADESHIALCLDPSKIDINNPDPAKLESSDIFYPTQRSFTGIFQEVKKSKLKITSPVILENAVRFSSNRDLGHVEKNIFEPDIKKIKPEGNIRIISAADIRSEIVWIARQILDLVKNQDMKFRDIAVIASDIESYRYYIEACFKDYDIPFFIDRRQALNQHPAAQFLSSALQIIINDFSSNDIFAYLKTDFLNQNRDRICQLENYCLSFGINSSDWQSGQEWKYDDPEEPRFDEALINKIKNEVISPLLRLRDQICKKNKPEKKLTSREFCEIVVDFANELKILETISQWIDEAGYNGDFETVEEHQQFCSKLSDIFDEMIEVFGDEKFTCLDFYAILNSAFSQLKLALIPPKIDQVLVGSIERSRHPDLKAVFLAGTTQKLFPTSINEYGILTDNDRRSAQSLGFSLSDSIEERLIQRQYLAYIAFTRPSQYLYITYPSSGSDGGFIVRSPFINELESLFVGLEEESFTLEDIKIENVNNSDELMDVLCQSVNEDIWYNLDDALSTDESFSEVESVLKSARNYDNKALLDKELNRLIYSDNTIKGSATQISTFSKCPYRHFAKYILRLKERDEFKLKPLDLGTFYHSILDLFFKRIKTEKINIREANDEDLLKILDQQIQEYINSDPFISRFKNHSFHNEFIINSAIEVLNRCVPGYIEIVRAGDFEPELTEASFGSVKDNLGELRYSLSNNYTFLIRGKIDRLDIAELDGKIAAVIFDYKLSSRPFKWSYFYNGLDIQLPIYMLSLIDSGQAKIKFDEAAGAFYLPINEELEKAEIENLSVRAEKFAYKSVGLFNGKFAAHLDNSASGASNYYNFFMKNNNEPYGYYNTRGVLTEKDFTNVLEFTRDKIKSIGESILTGTIEVKPYRLGSESACTYCPYKPVCRFDWQINEYNRMQSHSKKDVLDELKINYGQKTE